MLQRVTEIRDGGYKPIVWERIFYSADTWSKWKVVSNNTQTFYVGGHKGVLLRLSNKNLYKMLTIKITGNGYGEKTIDTIIQGYHYTPEGNFIQCKQLNNGANLSACKFMIIDNVIALWIPTPGLYSTIIVDIYESNTIDDTVPFYLMGYNYDVSGSYDTYCQIVEGKSVATLSLSSRTYLNYPTIWTNLQIPINNFSTNTNNLFSQSGNGIKVNRDAKLLIDAHLGFIIDSTYNGELDFNVLSSIGDLGSDFGNDSHQYQSRSIPSIYKNIPSGTVITLGIMAGSANNFTILEQQTYLTLKEV